MRRTGTTVLTLVLATALWVPAFAQSVPLTAPVAQSVEAVQAAQGVQSFQGVQLRGKTNVEKAMGKCAGSLILGALLGAAVGAAAGDTGTGALIGAGAGAVACAIFLKLGSNADKKLIRDAQLVALNTNAADNREWRTDSGELASARVFPVATGAVLVGKNGSIACRADNYCRVGDSWVPRDSILAGNIGDAVPLKVAATVTGAQNLVCRRTATSVRVGDQQVPDTNDVACLVGDSWVTGSDLKKNKIREADIVV